MPRKQTNKMTWREKDHNFAYEGPLGPELLEDGRAILRVWAPSATLVEVHLYNKYDQYHELATLKMTRGERGVWHIELNKLNTGLASLDGYFYHYRIYEGKRSRLALDPYAKSMAAWDGKASDAYIGKAAIVDPAKVDVPLDYAEIPGYTKREDAIIYETHVRDFSSDPSIDGALEANFGTFKAFAERLPYLKDLGVTHIQLLPVMNFLNVNELRAVERTLTYDSNCGKYNWGYDPHHYFALTGMYNSNPLDPYCRIEEFKALVHAIHGQGMGVILDVVYNHTGGLYVLENLEPHYYHFMNNDGTARTNFGGGRLGTTHFMTRRLVIDSLVYLTQTYKVDGFRFDMMGDLDAETVQLAYDEVSKLNPNTLMLGEGWDTYVGDEAEPNVRPANQQWMKLTNDVSSFSDEYRNILKGGFGSEGYPYFLTKGPTDVQKLFQNIKAQPSNFIADDPGDVVQYIEAHDNMTLHDVIAYSIQKDPDKAKEEIHQRIRLGNLLLMTSQGIAFMHSGQEYGRTKQFKHPAYKTEVANECRPHRSILARDSQGKPFDYPYFIDDSYVSSDAINMFEWQKVLDSEAYPIEYQTYQYTRGLIHLRRATPAFHLGTLAEVDQAVQALYLPEIALADLAIAYEIKDAQATYIIVVNADERRRQFTFKQDLTGSRILADQRQVKVSGISAPQGVKISQSQLSLEPLTGVILQKVQPGVYK